MISSILSNLGHSAPGSNDESSPGATDSVALRKLDAEIVSLGSRRDAALAILSEREDAQAASTLVSVNARLSVLPAQRVKLAADLRVQADKQAQQALAQRKADAWT